LLVGLSPKLRGIFTAPAKVLLPTFFSVSIYHGLSTLLMSIVIYTILAKLSCSK
jgi:hypothetical protein